MLTCKEVTERVTAYLEGDLSWWARVQFRLHLAMCRFCRRYVSQMRTTLALLRGLAEQSAAGGSMESLRDAFRVWRNEQQRP